MTAEVRQWFYRIAALASAVVPILVATRLVTESQGNQWLGLIAAIGGILGVAGSGTAAVVLGKQRKDGTLDPAPEVPVVSPADQVIAGLPAVVQQAEAAVAELDRVKQAASDVLGQAPILGPLAQQAIDSMKLPKL